MNRKILRLTILCICVFDVTLAYEVLHTKTPVVVHHGQSETDGRQIFDEDNQFGYSLAFMNGTHSNRFWGSSGKTHGTIFIGAPNEKRLKNSGVVWGCQFLENGGLRCSLVSSISTKATASESTSNTCRDDTIFPEREEEQRIGETLNSAAGRLIACAPRWKMNNFRTQSRRNNYEGGKCTKDTALLGACYFADTKDQVVQKAPYLNNQSDFYYPTYSSSNKEEKNPFLLYAEFGFSTHVSTALQSPSLFFGSPYARRQGVFGEYLYQRDTTTAIYNYREEVPKISLNSYLGYSITSGITRGREFFLASGAPRAENLLGVVILLLPRDASNKKAIVGKQFGSYFGYSISSVDLNGDGMHELLVGAPYQSADIKSQSGINTGCVFIYDVEAIFNTGRDQVAKTLCPDAATVSRGAKFGSAIANMGDINFDTFEDFAVGAPYDEDGVGSVFIYHGNSQPSFSTSPAQVVKGKAFEIPGLRAFGSSLLTGSDVDIDGNKTPDLAVGAFESRHVLVLRTKPTAKTDIRISFQDPQTNKMIIKFLPTQRTVRVRTCVKHVFSVLVPPATTLRTWVRQEIFLRDNENIDIRNSFDSEISEQQHDLRINGCLDRDYQLKQTIVEDKEYSIVFRATLWYNETDESSFPLSKAEMTLFTTSSSQQEQFTQSQNFDNIFRQFNPYLPAPHTDSKEETLVIAKDNCDSDGRAKCSPDLKLRILIEYENSHGKKWDHNEEDSKSLIVGDVDTLTFAITLFNLQETAYRPTMLATLRMSDNLDFKEAKTFLRFRWTHRFGKQRPCETSKIDYNLNEGNGLEHFLRCSQSLQNEDMMKYAWTISNMRGLLLNKNSDVGQINFTVDAYPDSVDDAERNEFKVKKGITIQLDENVDIFIEDSKSGQSAIDPRATNVDLIQVYELKNSGLSSTAIGSMKVEILIPAFTFINGKRTEVIGVAAPVGENIRCEGKFHDPSKDDSSTTTSNTSMDGVPSRATRSASPEKPGPPKLQVINPEAATLDTSSDDKVVTLKGCDTPDGRLLCEKITCYTELPAKSSKQIRISMYLHKQSKDDLLEEDTMGMRIVSKITVTYRNKKVKAIMGRTERKFNPTKGVPAYVYLLSAGGGAILFLLMTFALFKCGFFRRKTKEQLQQLKRQTMHMGDMQQFQVLPNDDDED